MVTRAFPLGAASLLALSLTTLASAESPAPATTPAPAPTAAAGAPRLHHEPPALAQPHTSLAIAATLDSPHLVKHVILVYRPTVGGALKEVPFLRSATGWLATIPEEDIDVGSLGYAIELELPDGKRVAVYASRDDLHLIAVPDLPDDARERAYLNQVDGRRVVFGAAFEYVSFGSSKSAASSAVKLPDWYLRAEGGFTYRPLRTVMEFGLRIGVVRGRSAVPIERSVDSTQCVKADDVKCTVGLNFGAPFVVFRLGDGWFLETNALVSVTEIGFSTGIGGAMHIGDYYGTKFVIGGETVKTFGSRAYARLDLIRGLLRVSPIVEVTDMPHADRAGVRLLAELGFDLRKGFGLTLRGGYQARDFDSGSFSLGGSFAYAF